MKVRQFLKMLKGKTDKVNIEYCTEDEVSTVCVKGYPIGRLSQVTVDELDENLDCVVDDKVHSLGDTLCYIDESLEDSMPLAQCLVEYVFNVKDSKGNRIPIDVTASYTFPKGSLMGSLKERGLI